MTRSTNDEYPRRDRVASTSGDLCLTKPIFCLFIVFISFAAAQFGWQTRDSFDEVKRKYDGATPDNCPILPTDRLYLSKDSEEDDTVTHKPDIKEININPVFPNRTALLHLHNVAMSRAFFWSYILQSRFIRPAINDTYDPGMMYYFLSTVADVSSNLRINASAIYFSTNSSFSPSYRGFFNKTFPLFAPRTYRADDFNDPIHLERISTLNTFLVKDLGAVPLDSLSQNYTTDFYRINEWYKLWLPDNVGERHDTKTTYQVRLIINGHKANLFSSTCGTKSELSTEKLKDIHKKKLDIGEKNYDIRRWLEHESLCYFKGTKY